tara:strand:- start:143 stop:319 length:177 start_codon:yes stop_codon:yes gene_type:complete
MNRKFDIENVTKYGTDYLKEYIRVTDAEHRRSLPRNKWQRQAELIEAELRWRKTHRNR